MRAFNKTFSSSFNLNVMRKGSLTLAATKLNVFLVVVTTLTAAANGFLIPHRKSVVAPDDLQVQSAAESLRNIPYNDAVPVNEPLSSVSVQCGAPSALPVLSATDPQSPSWPWVVSIRAENGHICGGTLIGNRWVLTAAVCANRLLSANYKVAVVGRRGSSESDQFSQTIPIEAVAVDDSDAGNLALLTLTEAVSFNSGSLPVCLPQSFQTVPAGRICWTTGWTENGLTQNLVTTVDSEMCGLHHPHHHQQQQNGQKRKDAATDITSVCTITVDSEHPCQVESPGSPMMCYEGSRWVLFGIAGTEDVCSTEDVSGTRMFQSVPAKVDWISRHIHGH